MPTRSLCLAALLLVACKEESAPPAKKAETVATQPPAPPPAPPDAAPPDAAPALPTDPKELAELRNKAVLENRYADAITICAVEDMAKLDEQSVLSCVLAACQKGDYEKAQAWAKQLKGPLLKQAKTVCAANKVPL
jgi:hypothetical protein